MVIIRPGQFPEDIVTKRPAVFALCKPLVMYMLRERSALTLVQIGKMFGVSYKAAFMSIDRFEKKMACDPKLESLHNI
ncbi:hypothetical protein ACFL6Y_06540 [Elusimicrobiota bacterium]